MQRSSSPEPFTPLTRCTDGWTEQGIHEISTPGHIVLYIDDIILVCNTQMGRGNHLNAFDGSCKQWGHELHWGSKVHVVFCSRSYSLYISTKDRNLSSISKVYYWWHQSFFIFRSIELFGAHGQGLYGILEGDNKVLCKQELHGMLGIWIWNYDHGL